MKYPQGCWRKWQRCWLTHKWLYSLEKAVVYDYRKTANICPIFKKGEQQLAENYRPVSLTCVTSKGMEHIVKSHIIMHYAVQNQLLFRKLIGFRSQKSRERLLIEFVAEITDNLDQAKQSEACVWDFSKAFVRVNHTKFILNLNDMGVSY